MAAVMWRWTRARQVDPDSNSFAAPAFGSPDAGALILTIGGCEREGEPLEMICRLRGAAEPKIVSPSVHEALLAYLKKHPVIDIQRGGRAIATDLPREVFSQDATLTGTTNAVPRPLRKG